MTIEDLSPVLNFHIRSLKRDATRKTQITDLAERRLRCKGARSCLYFPREHSVLRQHEELGRLIAELQKYAMDVNSTVGQNICARNFRRSARRLDLNHNHY